MGQSGRRWQCCYLMIAVLVLMGRDIISAMPCSTITSSAGSRVECSHHRMTRFPDHVPDDVVWLDMSSNFLTSLDSIKNPQFATLQYLDISYNKLSYLPDDMFLATQTLQSLDLGYNTLGTLRSNVFNGLSNLTTLELPTTGLHFLSDTIFRNMTHLVSLDLSNNSLSSIPTAALQYVTSLQYLDLSRNALTTIHNHSLNSLSNLQYLSLYSNQLTSLQPAAFDGLERLVTLDIRFNQLKFDFGYPPGVFSPLVSLQNLDMFGNFGADYEGDYPVGVFDPLQSLKTLSIDTFHDPHFGAAFRNLSTLSSLRFSSNDGKGCNMNWMRNDTFTAFHGSVLQALSIETCPLIRVETCAFCNLPHLTKLAVSGCHHVRLSNLFLALYGVQYQTFEEVSFTYIKRYVPIILDQKVMVYINNMCIERLTLTFCKIAGISLNAFKFNGNLLKCLKKIDLSWNAIAGGRASQFMKLSIGMINIESFMMHNQMIFTIGNKIYHHLPSDKGRPRPDVIMYVNTAPSLRFMNVSAGVRDISKLPKQIHFPYGGNVTGLDFSYCGAYWCDSVITGLTSIRTLDFSGNDCYVIGDWLFQHMPTLQRLMLSKVYLQERFLFSNGTSLFQPLSNLEELDLSNNQLQSLPTDLLKYQSRLKRLILARNQFEIIVLVTQDFMEDDLSGYTVLHVQASLSDTMPRRVLLLYVGRLEPGDRTHPTHLSMRRLLRVLPENNVYHVPRNIARHPAHPVWPSLTRAILDDEKE